MPIIEATQKRDSAISLFHSLADPTRLTIIRSLAAGESRVTDLVDQLGLAQSTVSEHVTYLRDCGLVEGRVDGRQTFYFLARPELLDLLESAERLLSATGYKVDLCGVYGTRAREHGRPT